MKIRERLPLPLFALIVAVGLVFAVATEPDHDARAGHGTLKLDAVQLPDLVGTWNGTWTDTVYSVMGDVSCEIDVNGDNWSAAGTIDLGALGLGEETGTATGLATDGELDFTFESSTVGSGEGVLVGGTGNGSGTVTGMLDFGDYLYEGTATPEVIWGTFEFLSVTGGAGRVVLHKDVPVEVHSWTDVRTRYR